MLIVLFTVDGFVYLENVYVFVGQYLIKIVDSINKWSDKLLMTFLDDWLCKIVTGRQYLYTSL